MASQQINNIYETSIEIPIGEDYSQFYVGLKIYGELKCNSLGLFSTLNHLKNVSLKHIATGDNSPGLTVKNHINGVPIELRMWTQGLTTIRFQEVSDEFTECFDEMQQILINDNLV